MAILFAILLTAIVAAAIITSRKKEPQPSSQQPIHFDLLDDNGEPIHEQPEPTIQELQYFCIKDKGYHVTVWPKGQKIPDYIEFEIAGMSYRDNIDDYLGEHAGTLEPEPDNEYDPNAIKVLAADGHHVGYVPKDMTAHVRDLTTLPCPCYFYIGDNDGIYYSDVYINKQ